MIRSILPTLLIGTAIVCAGRPGIANAAPVPDCLWAGTTHPSGATVTAGGAAFRCGTDAAGTPAWSSAGATNQPATVSVSGADGNPTDAFSAGAEQPGTSYDDYCVGDQLIPGTADVYRAQRGDDGRLYWKAAAPISTWRFDPGVARPQPTWRTDSLCHDGNLT